MEKIYLVIDTGIDEQDETYQDIIGAYKSPDKAKEKLKQLTNRVIDEMQAKKSIFIFEHCNMEIEEGKCSGFYDLSSPMYQEIYIQELKLE